MTRARTFGAAAESYLRRKAHVSPTTEEYVGRFVRKWGKLDVTEITSDRLNDWVDDRLATVQRSTARRELTACLAVLSHARGKGWLAAVPWVEKPEDGDARLRYLNADEERRFLAVLAETNPAGLALAQFLLNTGARLGEAMALKPADVIGGDQVVLRTRKRRAGRMAERRVPLNEVSLRAIKHGWGYRKSAGGAYALYKAARLAGIEDFVPHDLRRTFATKMLMLGASPRTVADLLGHVSLDMVMRYMRVPEATAAAAVKALVAA